MSRTCSLLLGVSVGVVVLAVCGGAAGTPAGLPLVSTVATTKGPIYALAQDRDRVVWIEKLFPQPECDSGEAVLVWTLVFSRPRPQRLFDPRGCSINARYALAVAGSRVVWDDRWFRYTQVRTIAVGEQRSTALEGEYGLWNESVTGSYVTEAAGDGNLLAYAVHTRTTARPECDPSQHDCQLVNRSSAKRVVGRKSRALRDVNGRQIAVAAPNIASLSYPGETAPRSVVDVRNARTGIPLTSFEVGARPRDLALTSRYVSVLFGGKRASIAIYDVHSGTRVRTIAVDRATTSLSASDRGILYVVGRDIYLIRLPSLVVRLVARAPLRSGELRASIEGSRVIWAERKGSGSRIRAIDIG